MDNKMKADKIHCGNCPQPDKPRCYAVCPIKAANDKETRERKAACKLDPDYAAHVMAFHDWYEKYGAGRKQK